MLLSNFVKSPRLFLYFGFGLIFSALFCLPVVVKVVVQPEVGETELWHIGPIFALLIGVWSLPSLFLGIIESTLSKKAILLVLTLILCVVNTILALLVWDALRFWRDMIVRWLLSYSPFISPCIIADATAILFFTKQAKLMSALRNLKIRALLLIVLMCVPLLFAAIALYMWLALLL
jgi:hypothetical protein